MRTLCYKSSTERFYIRHQFSQPKFPHLVMSSRFLFFKDKSFTAVKPHSAEYDDGKGSSNFTSKLVECGYLVCVSSQSHPITHFILNNILTDSSSYIYILLGTASKYQIYPLALAVSPMLENQFVLN